MSITIVRSGCPVTYRLAIVRCACTSWLVVRGFAVRDCGRCGEVPFA